jgi:hypothetical protein
MRFGCVVASNNHQTEWVRKLRYFGDKTVPEAVMLAQKKISMAVLRGLVLNTPVDTGRARGNWDVTIDVQQFENSELLDKSGGQAIARGQEVVNAINRLGSVIFIQNNVPYILSLEHGSSKQAPAGMLKLTLQSIRAQLR